MMDITQLLVNQGVAGAVLIWFMMKNSKDMASLQQSHQVEQQQTREVINDLKVVIAKIGGVDSE